MRRMGLELEGKVLVLVDIALVGMVLVLVGIVLVDIVLVGIALVGIVPVGTVLVLVGTVLEPSCRLGAAGFVTRKVAGRLPPLPHPSSACCGGTGRKR